ncbi:TolC family protein [Mesobacterium pallidum]|uniref:TolC family protein n=1 Tax=Mesobacterium pallidum TaxID=2872037 RepID=UPI001EE20E3D|nr:TolC family protein [Mesobacterium pallidum]
MKTVAAISAAVLLSACAQTSIVQVASKDRAGFDTVQTGAQRAVGASPEWALSATEIQALDQRVHGLVHKKTINADIAVQVAIINNRALQANFADLGLSSTELWEVAMGPIPSVGVSVSGLAGDVTRSLESLVMQSILDLATRKPRTEIAQIRFRQAQLNALSETIALAIETRRAWIEAVGAFEKAALIAEAQNTADSASELASQLGRTGFMSKADQAREHTLTAVLAAERSEARLEAQLAKERLIRLMGLSGSATEVFVPNALPKLPSRPRASADIERLALVNRVDLAVGKLELEAVAREYRLSGKTRMISDIALAAGLEAETNDGDTEVSPALSVDFEIPLYDTGRLASKRGQMNYLRVANSLAQKAIDARAEARMAYKSVTGRHAVARHWRDVVLPLRRTIDEESLKSYSGMITSTFELLEDARDGLEAQIGAAEAKRAYWLAETEMTAAIWGGSGGAVAGGDEEDKE